MSLSNSAEKETAAYSLETFENKFAKKTVEKFTG